MNTTNPTLAPTLVLMAAGRGTRYGGLKQLEGFGPHGELIMDYAIADAVAAGFNKVVLIIREEHRALFEEKMVVHALRDQFHLEYAYQEQPLGTADAVRSAAPYINGPCVVLNCDDYYGGAGVFRQARGWLAENALEGMPLRYATLGYDIMAVLSPHGTVVRGICNVDADGKLLQLNETFDIQQVDGSITGKLADGTPVEVASSALCSMNFFLFPRAFLDEVQKDFLEYISKPRIEGRAGEFLLPPLLDQHRREGRAEVFAPRAVESQWCGVTNPSDREGVVQALASYHLEGRYGVLRLP